MLQNTNNKHYAKLKPFLDARVLGLVLFGIIVLLVSWSGLKILQTNYELEKELAQLRQKVDVRRLENENLKLKNEYYETDQYLELSARRQFGKAAPGETLYAVPASVALSKTVELPKEEPTTQKSTEDNKPKYQQNFDAWMDFFFSKNKQ